MGKYTTSSRRPPPPKRDSLPAVVKGIGCLMFALVPILGYGLGALVVNYGTSRGWPIPANWLGAPQIAPPAQNIPVISEFVTLLLRQNNLIANLVFMIGISVVLFGLIAIIYGYVYSISGPSQYGPQDVPPPRVKTRKYRR